MRAQTLTPLAGLTTLRLGGPARRLVEAADVDAVVSAVRAADAAREPLLVLAGGSNVVVADEGFAGTVLLLRTTGIRTVRYGDGVHVTVAAGHDWEDLVAHCVAEGLVGIECLSGIPGSTGATPVQNVGAYGQEVAETICGVHAYDRVAGRTVTLSPADCGFAYRSSVFKDDCSGRYVVLDVTFTLVPGRQSGPLRFGELTRVLGVPAGGVAPLGDVRDTVLALRRGKGMVLDDADPDTRSVGSFFTNPVLSDGEWDALVGRCAAALGPGVRPPRWDAGLGRVKTSAAWLIERSGFAKGYGRDGVAISSKHTLALTHRGGGSTAALLGLAREIRDGVRDRLGVTLVNEPVLVGATL